MVLDHLGLALIVYCTSNSVALQIGNIFRYMGRLSMPLFAFCIIEGLMHTKNIKQYLLRMGIASLFITLCMIPLTIYIPNINLSGNIFLTFFMAILTVYLFSLNNQYKYFGILPILYVVTSFIITSLEVNGINCFFFPTYLRCDYDLIAFGLIIITYYCLKLYIKKTKTICLSNNISIETYMDTTDYKFRYNLIFVLVLSAITIIITALKYLSGFKNYLVYQNYMILSGLFVLFYSHKLGFHNNITKFGFYIFYPLHIAIIFGIFMIIFN